MWSRIVILFSSTPIVLGEDFQHYMEVFFPFLKLALQNYAAYQVHFVEQLYLVEEVSIECVLEMNKVNPLSEQPFCQSYAK